MNTISAEDFEREPAVFLKRVEAGETFLVMRGDRAIAELRPVGPTGTRQRPFGLAAGEFALPDDFDAPLPDEEVRAFCE